MRYILFSLFFLCSLNSWSQNAWKNEWLKPDKVAHFNVSMIGTCFLVEIAKDLKFKNPELAGAIAMTFIGIGKEFLYDPTADSRDIASGFIGVNAGILVSRWFQKIENRHYLKKHRLPYYKHKTNK